MSTVTTNMGMTIPTVSTDIGPGYATMINNAFTRVDEHDHSNGKGVKLTPNGFNINSDLAFGGNNATGVKSIRFNAQGAPLSSSSDLGCSYFSGVDFYVNDLNGNQIRLTQSGGVAGSPGSITNLTSPASVTWVAASSKYVFQAGVNLAGDLDCRSVILRNSAASSYGMTLSPPDAMASDLSMKLPSVTSSATSFVTIASDGTMAQGRPSTVGQQLSSVCTASFTGHVLTYSSVSNLSVSITTIGRPVQLILQPERHGPNAVNGAGSSSGSIIMYTLGATNPSLYVMTQRNGSSTFEVALSKSPGAGKIDAIPASAFSWFDTPSAGTYIYSISAKMETFGTATAYFDGIKLLAYEL